MESLASEYGIKTFEYKSFTELEANNIHFFIDDKLTNLIEINYGHVLDLPDHFASEFGIMFAKNSKFKNDINPYIDHYLKTSRYYRLLEKHFNTESVNFIKEYNRQELAR